MHSFYFIINKQSRNSHDVFKKLLVLLPKHKVDYDFLVTESIEQLDTLLSQLKNTIQPTDIIVVVGGDGSLNQFVTFYSKYCFNNPIGYIPAGSGNDFARANVIPFDTEEALFHLFSVKRAKERSVILATQNQTEHLAVNSIGFGIDGLIGKFIDSKGKKEKAGGYAYALSIFSGFLKQEKFPLTLTLDDGVHVFDQAQLVLVANNPYFGGGINIVPQASGVDDQLDILIADNVNVKDLISILSKLFFKQTHLSHPKLYSFQTKEATVHINSGQYAQKDGEVFHQDEYMYYFKSEKLLFWI
ncbi:diacylglycerol/lipid kinase family protein [Alkalibacterium kapii]|uniref:Diacylglycerol kinase n=1 Tax=Alkalibacterium kapii TaxID=426704 RepID=A0A511AWU9_9LACT|nr:diacylglycerol kinase family protein [Alkalibacterium kapii]GEK91803.1 diacylglycerol kinase [Alkalibacterium kapii]